MERETKSTATVMLAFFVVMMSFLGFIILIPNKELVHWLSFLFILLAEFSFFIGHLFIQMLPEKSNHPTSLKILRYYLITTIVLAGTFMLLRLDDPTIIIGVLFSLFLISMAGLYILGSKGELVEDEDQR